MHGHSSAHCTKQYAYTELGRKLNGSFMDLGREHYQLGNNHEACIHIGRDLGL